MRTIDIDQMQFLVNELHRKGKVPLLLINGMRMKLGVFNKLKRRLEFSTINFDFPTWWNPSWRWFVSPMSDIAYKIVRLIEALGHKQVDVLGVSWGGTLAIELAMLYPERVRKLVLVSTTARPYRMWRPHSIKAYLNRDYGGAVGTKPELLAEAKTRAGSSSVFTDLYRGLALPFWYGVIRLPFVRQQTLIINGTDDPITPATEAVYIHEQIKDSQLLLVEGEGHLLIYSNPDKVAARVNHFLATA